MVSGDVCMKDSDYACENHLGCNRGICTLYGSLQDYAVADNELVCKSGYAEVLDGQKQSICLPSPLIKDKRMEDDYKCSGVKDTCLYESDVGKEVGNVHQFRLPCECGLSESGEAF